MLKILDLFAGTQSVKKALDLLNIEYEYYGIDIIEPNIILDLSQDLVLDNLISLLPKNWKPNFIWASPVCNKFSLATAVKGGNLYFEKTNPGLKIRSNFKVLENTNYKNKDPQSIIDDAKYHLKMVNNMQNIIDHYNVDFIIENPYDSYIVYFLDPMYIRSKADYCMYGFKYKKPTAIFSSLPLDLKTCIHEYHETKIGTLRKNNKISISSYSERASVPSELIIDIFKRFRLINGGEKIG